MNVIDVTASLYALVTSHKQAATEVTHLSSDDPFLPVLQAFIAETSAKIDNLKRLHRDLLAELASVLVYFAEKPNGGVGVEDVFTTILAFGFGLQKAAAEMSKFPNIATDKSPVPVLAPRPAIHIARPSSSSSNAESDITPTGTLTAATQDRRPSSEGLDVPDKMVQRGTLTRGEFDEAIRTIHGGARRRERREASMASSVAGSVKLSRIFLDGSGTSTRAGLGTAGTRRKSQGGHTRLGSVFR